MPGYFTDFSGTINYNADDETKSSVEFTAKTTSVDTRVEGRNKHLRSADFFDVENHPEMTFKSTKVAKSGDKLMVTGDFTLRGVTKSITIPVKVAGFAEGRGGKVMGAMSETTIDRTAYGVNYNPEGNVISKDVKVILNVEARQAK
ncbi:MAG: YceI family protein [Pyrinomonadaceae bacterium]